MLGSFAVGKTSLVRQFVSSMFDDRYLTTVGVKIDKKEIDVDGTKVTLMLWDMHGEDEFQKLRVSYLRGAHGYLLVADGTRQQTLHKAAFLQDLAQRTLGDAPFLLLLNKADLKDQWTLTDESIGDLEERGWTILETSAKTGQNVEEAFSALAGRMLG